MTLPVIATSSSALCSGALAATALLRARRSVSHWSFLLGVLALAFESLFRLYIYAAATPQEVVYWQQWEYLAASFLPGTWLAFSLTYARGNAREFLVRWRFVLLAALLAPLAFTLAFRRQLLRLHEDFEHRVWTMQLGPAGFALHLCLLAGSILILINLERTYRASLGTMRWRIKFMLMGVAVIFVTRIYTATQVMLFHGVDPGLEVLDAFAVVLATLFIIRSLLRAGGPLGVDVYPSQSVLQGSLTVILVGVYFLVVGVLSKVVSFFGANPGSAYPALLVLVALVSLAVLLQSDRFRLRLRLLISRHFERPLYDYRAAWKTFNDGTASCGSQLDLSRSVVRLLAEMMHVLSVSMWLVDETNASCTLVASTSLSGIVGQQLAPPSAEVRDLLRHFSKRSDPEIFEYSPDPWAVALRRWHPSEFPNGGSRVCVPMLGRGQVLAFILVGDRIGGIPFSQQDLDLLKCVADHAAASLLNIQLAERLLQAREMEAFQNMAAFFVHDLKNLGSTLGLMLRNLPVHFDDPNFRQDALRGIAKTTDHLNRLVGRLSQIRHETSIQLVEGDLNEVVRRALAGLESHSGARIVTSFQAMPGVPMDPDQIQKVVTNLVLNALEAVAANGEVRIATSCSGNSAALLVADNGCGMAADFVQHSLFKPFKTTKKTGLGIGMFQSRMVVEAHRGKITVASEPGKGTTFQVMLPLARIAP